MKQEKGQWNSAAQRRHTLSWFKESVIQSLCGSYTSRKHNSSVQLTYSTLPIQSIEMVLKHQIRPISEIANVGYTQNRCLVCKAQRRTACLTCKRPYCYECGIKHLSDLVQQHLTRTQESEESQIKPHQTPQYTSANDVYNNSDSSDLDL